MANGIAYNLLMQSKALEDGDWLRRVREQAAQRSGSGSAAGTAYGGAQGSGAAGSGSSNNNGGGAAQGGGTAGSVWTAGGSGKSGGSLAAGSGGAPSASLAQASPTGGNGLRGLSAGTMAGLAQYGQAYTPSKAVREAQSYLQGVMDGQPGNFQSRYAGQIADLYDQIMNRPKFSYDVNKDPLFQQYKNQYTVQGQRAMQDVMGDAAALSGGYGNSWGNTAGFQAYQAYLQQLNDRIPELEQRAFDRYAYEGEELRNNMNLSTALDNIDYGRYRDTVADWQANRAFANTLYSQERGWDMADWQNMQDHYRTMAGMENGDYWTAQELAEKQRQYDSDMEYQRYKAALDEAYRRDTLGEDIRQFDANLLEKQRQFDAAQALDQAKFDQQLRQYEDALAKAAGSGSGGGTAAAAKPGLADWLWTVGEKVKSAAGNMSAAGAKGGAAGRVFDEAKAAAKGSPSQTQKEQRNKNRPTGKDKNAVDLRALLDAF